MSNDLNEVVLTDMALSARARDMAERLRDAAESCPSWRRLAVLPVATMIADVLRAGDCGH